MKSNPKLGLIAAVAITACSLYAQEVQVVKIGHVAPMTGGLAPYGKDNANGALLAVEELNAQGIVINGKKIKFELLAEDDEANPQKGVVTAQKLCAGKVAGVVGHFTSGTTIAASKIYSDSGIPHITASATNPTLTKPGYKTTYRLIASDNSLGAGVATYAADALKVKNVAIIDDGSDYGMGVAEVFKKTATSKGLTVVAEKHIKSDATDFSTVLAAINASKPDAIFFGGMGTQGGPMLKQMEQLGLNDVKFLGGDGICTRDFINGTAGAKTINNVVCAEAGVPLETLPAGKALRSKYDARFPGEYRVYSPYTYDATLVLVDAMKRANSTDPGVYLPKLMETNYQGVTGTIAFETNGERKNPLMTLNAYKDGNRVAIR